MDQDRSVAGFQPSFLDAFSSGVDVPEHLRRDSWSTCESQACRTMTVYLCADYEVVSIRRMIFADEAKASSFAHRL